MAVAYVVLQTEWQYNDEFYYRETDGGIPFRAFNDKLKAEMECISQNIKKARADLAQFLGEEGFHQVKDKALRERLAISDRSDNYYDYTLPAGTTDADILALLKAMRMEFFVVKPVSLE